MTHLADRMPVAPSPVTVPPMRVVFEEADRRQILQAIDQCLASGWVAGGKHVKAFEECWAAYCRATHGVACSSGGAALELIMKALDVQGKDVLVPTNTFIATANAVTLAGGRPVFLDADPATLGVSLKEIRRKVTDRTAAVMVVHIGGIMSAEMPAIAAWCKARKIWLVEDAAHAHGSEADGLRAGAFGVAAAYSFFATKVITSGEGGMVVTNDDALAETCRRLRDYGKRSDWETVHTRISTNYRMNELESIVALSQARRLDEFIAARQAAADRYTEGLRGVLDLVLPAGRCSWYKYIVCLPEGVDRAEWKAQLKALGVSVSGGVYDLPLHLQPVFEPLGLRGTLPKAESVCARHVCLPIFYGMTAEQIDHVIASVRTVTAR